MRKTISVAASALLGLALLAPATAQAGTAQAGTAAPTAAPASCSVTWGSLARHDPGEAGSGTLTDVRAGRHACFDRVVVDLAGVPVDEVGYDASYVDTVLEPGTGDVVPLAGGARLRVAVTVPAYDDQGRPTYTPRDRYRLVDVRGWDTLRQVAMAGSFEGQTDLGVGVRARLPYRVFLLAGPGSGSRLVIDVAHRW